MVWKRLDTMVSEKEHEMIDKLEDALEPQIAELLKEKAEEIQRTRIKISPEERLMKLAKQAIFLKKFRELKQQQEKKLQ